MSAPTSGSGRSSSTWSAGAGCPRSSAAATSSSTRPASRCSSSTRARCIDRHRVIVGKPFHKTPMFSDKIAYAEFNPTWTVTPAIASGRVPAQAQGRSRLSRAQRLRALRRLGRRRAGHRPVVGRLEFGRRQEIPLPDRAAAGAEERAWRRQVHVSEQVQHLPARHAVAGSCSPRPAAPSAMAASACRSR